MVASGVFIRDHRNQRHEYICAIFPLPPSFEHTEYPSSFVAAIGGKARLFVLKFLRGIRIFQEGY